MTDSNPKPAPSLDTNSVADSTGEKTGTHGASKEAGGHSRGGLTPVSPLSPKPAPDAMERTHKQLRALWEALDGGPKPRCRECADYNGRCPSDNLPCEPQERALEQIANMQRPLAAPVPSPDATLQTSTEICRNKNCPRGGMPVEVVLPSSPSPAVAAEPGLRDIVRDKMRGALAEAHPGHPALAAPPVRGDREAIARIIAPESFAADYQHYFPDRSTVEQFEAYKKADAILALPVQPGAGERHG